MLRRMLKKYCYLYYIFNFYIANFDFNTVLLSQTNAILPQIKMIHIKPYNLFQFTVKNLKLFN